MAQGGNHACYDEVKRDQLQLESEKSDKTVSNWQGGNLSFIKGLEMKDENACEQRLMKLECLFVDKSVKLSESFKKDLRKAPSGLQELVLSRFSDVYKADLLFPSRGDDKLVKYCEGSGNEETYELRSKSMGGMRATSIQINIHCLLQFCILKPNQWAWSSLRILIMPLP